MLSTNPSGILEEAQIARRALDLFVTTYGLTWSDSYVAAEYESRGGFISDRVLSLISRSGCSFADALAAVRATDRMLAADMWQIAA